MGIISMLMLRLCKDYLYVLVLSTFYFYPMYLSSLKSLDKYMASFDHKIPNIDLSSQTVILMKCFINLPEYRVDFENIKCV